MYHWYVSPEKQAKRYKNTTSMCWKCEQHKGTFYHLWLISIKLKKLDTKTFVNSEDFKDLYMKPESFLLGLMYTAGKQLCYFAPMHDNGREIIICSKMEKVQQYV